MHTKSVLLAAALVTSVAAQDFYDNDYTYSLVARARGEGGSSKGFRAKAHRMKDRVKNKLGGGHKSHHSKHHNKAQNTGPSTDTQSPAQTPPTTEPTAEQPALGARDVDYEEDILELMARDLDLDDDYMEFYAREAAPGDHRQKAKQGFRKFKERVRNGGHRSPKASKGQPTTPQTSDATNAQPEQPQPEPAANGRRDLADIDYLEYVLNTRDFDDYEDILAERDDEE